MSDSKMPSSSKIQGPNSDLALADAIRSLPPRLREAAELLEQARHSQNGIELHVADPKMTDRMRDYLWRARRALSAKGFDHYRHLAVLRRPFDELLIVRRDRVDAREPLCISDSIRDLRLAELPNRVQHARGPRPLPDPEAVAKFANDFLKGLKMPA